jgi:hypothetical protein
VNTTAQDDITGYVEAVRAALADLPDATRDELLEDLPEHLAEVKADGAGSLIDRLGTPEAYAAELLITAGFVGGFPDPPPRPDRWAEIRDPALRRLRRLDIRTGPLFGYERASDFLVLLRPAWWVLRGYLVAMVIAWALDDSGQPQGLLPRIGGSEVVAVLMLAGGILGSIWLGRRQTRELAQWPRYALYAGSVVLVLVAIGGFLNADSDARGANYSDVNYGGGGDPNSRVQDVFVYDQNGRLIPGARLFDQDGQPIRLGVPSCYSEVDGYAAEVRANQGYPYCPSSAPFQTAPNAGAPSASVSPGPESPAPAPTPTVTPPPSSSVRPSPSASPSKIR